MEIDIHKIRKPNVSEELAVELARTLYGLEVIEIKNMVSFNDQNFRIKAAILDSIPVTTSAAWRDSFISPSIAWRLARDVKLAPNNLI
ncbi:hypothetical protein TNCV_2846321 [Trichonephila clavipes]|nr:hypothetical protein TNCV_2846321 [Trichonephila clavipes]